MKNILKEKPERDIYGSRTERAKMMQNQDIKGKNVLDIGCGFGWCEADLLKRGATKIVGVDVTNDSKEAFESLNPNKVKFVQASATELPFKDNLFDTVVSWEVLEHIPKSTEEIMFKEIQRVLKKGGVFYMSTQYKHPVSNVLDPAWWLIGHRHYSLKNIKSFAESANFKIDKLYTKGGLYTIIFNLNMYVAKWVFRRKPFFNEKFRELSTKEFQKKKGYTNIFARLVK